MKEVSQRFHLHETLGAGTRRETESRREAARGWEGERDEQVEFREFLGSETIMYDNFMWIHGITYL